MLDATALIEKYQRRGVLVDTNLLVLLLVGLTNPARITTFKRTQSYTVEDFGLLQNLIVWFGKPLIATPHLLAEVSNLTDLPDREMIQVRKLFQSLVERLEEQYDTARDLVATAFFQKFGLTDASIAAVSGKGVLILTADLQLQLALQAKGFDALNFNHVRALRWGLSRG